MKRIQLVLISSILSGAATITAPRNPARYQQAADAVQAALSDGNYATELPAFRRLLEIHPNDPQLKAYFYLAMGTAADKAGETKDAQLYKRMAQMLDWGIDWRVGKPDTAEAIMRSAAQSLATIEKAREDARPKSAARPQPMYNYPPAPAGAPEYKAPAEYQPMPGYAAASTAGPVSMPFMNTGPRGGTVPPPSPNSAPPPSPQAAPDQTRPAQSSAPPPPPPPPQFQPNPNAVPPPGFPQPLPQNQRPPSSEGPPSPQFRTSGREGGPKPPMPYVAGAMGSGMSGGPPIGYQKPIDPYVMQQSTAVGRQNLRRGEAAKPMRVVHDHSQLGDKTYFETGCGALLTVEDGALIFTSGVEAPRSIAASEIVDLRMNVEIGSAIGAFHVLTKRGLFLNLVPEGATREQGRLFVDALRKQLGLVE